MSAMVEIRKSDDLTDLVTLAGDVDTSTPCRNASMTARDAARALSGLASWVVSRIGLIRMQEIMGTLARHQSAWRGPQYMQSLPLESDGTVDENVALVAVVASSLVYAFGPQNLRSAVAYWASERDPVSWQRVCEVS